MNEQQFAEEIRRALDESAGKMPYRVTHRLEQARVAALARASEVQAARHAPSSAESTVGETTGGAGVLGGGGRETTPLWWRAVASLLPLLIVVAGLLAISLWSDTEIADETAEVDLAVLTDDVPISAYADRGFGVFLKNSRQ